MSAPAPTTPPKRAPAPRLDDPKFRDKVLAKHGVFIHPNEYINSDWWVHFNFRPLELSRDWDRRLEQFTDPNASPNLSELRIWRRPTDQYIQDLQREYGAMFDFLSNEAEYQDYALENILLNERRYRKDHSFPKEDLVPVRMIELVQKPEPNSPTWATPPCISADDAADDAEEKPYEWDIRPDCTYYVNLRAFPEKYRSLISKEIAVVKDLAYAPYLTIEFKKQNEVPCGAKHQVAVASTLALYNRWLLKSRAIKDSQ